MYILGVDPGLKGALVLMKNNTVQTLTMMPTETIKKKSFVDIKAVKKWVNTQHSFYPISKVLIEKQMVVSNQGLSSSGKTMYQFGLLQGLFEGLDLSPIIVTPLQWQKSIFPRVDETNIKTYNYADTKLKSIAFVEQNYNSSYLFTSSRQRKPSDGIADAICIATYGFSLSN